MSTPHSLLEAQFTLNVFNGLTRIVLTSFAAFLPGLDGQWIHEEVSAKPVPLPLRAAFSSR